MVVDNKNIAWRTRFFYGVKMCKSVLFEKKIITPNLLKRTLNSVIPPIVFTNGCFDILHRGHVTYLAAAKALGNILIVAVNTDDSVKRQGKDNNRPINLLENRMAVIAALESVDFVTWFDEDTPFNLIEYLQPDILVKGGDWVVEQIVGAKEILRRGGQVHSIPFVYNTSTTIIIEKIKRS